MPSAEGFKIYLFHIFFDDYMQKRILLDSSVIVSLIGPDWRGPVTQLRLEEVKSDSSYKIVSCAVVNSELEGKFPGTLNLYNKYIEEEYPINSGIAKLARTYIDTVKDICSVSVPRADAIIMATATIKEVEIVLTWNFEHMDNIEISNIIKRINVEKKLKMPWITNPRDFIP